MKLRWDSPFSNYTWGVRCDNCGVEDDPEGYNMGWASLTTVMGDFDYCGKDCAIEHITTWGWSTNAPERDRNYLGGCKDYNIKCRHSHDEERRMLAPDRPAPEGWILFECDCGNFRFLQDTEAHRNVAKYSRRR